MELITALKVFFSFFAPTKPVGFARSRHQQYCTKWMYSNKEANRTRERLDINAKKKKNLHEPKAANNLISPSKTA